MDNKLKIVETENGLEIINKDTSISILTTENGMEVSYKCFIKLTFEGEIQIGINGDFNMITKGFYIYTMESPIHLNIRMAKQIRDLPESIKYREKQIRISEKNMEDAEM